MDKQQEHKILRKLYFEVADSEGFRCQPAALAEGFDVSRVTDVEVREGFRLVTTPTSVLKLRLRRVAEAGWEECLGFRFSPEDQDDRRRAISRAERFMKERMSFGRKPGVCGVRGFDAEKHTVWLTPDSAWRYGMTKGVDIRPGIRDGTIERRAYTHEGAGRPRYEYRLDSIERWIGVEKLKESSGGA